MVGIIQLGICDVVLGNRIRTRQEALSGGMPLYKYLGNRVLTFVSNIMLGQNLGEFHSGLRAFTQRVLETIPFELNSDDFVFDQQFLFQAAILGIPLRRCARAYALLPRSFIYQVVAKPQVRP